MNKLDGLHSELQNIGDFLEKNKPKDKKYFEYASDLAGQYPLLSDIIWKWQRTKKDDLLNMAIDFCHKHWHSEAILVLVEDVGYDILFHFWHEHVDGMDLVVSRNQHLFTN